MDEQKKRLPISETMVGVNARKVKFSPLQERLVPEIYREDGGQQGGLRPPSFQDL